jgi:hypothetical protein
VDVTVIEVNSEQCSRAIERFALWVAGFPGVWSVTVKDARLNARTVDLHLVVHSVLEDEVGAKNEMGRRL